MRLNRVMQMGLPEIASRSVQELRKRFERNGLGGERDPASKLLGALAPTRELGEVRARLRAGDLDAAGRLLLGRFVEDGPRRFFEGAASADVPALLTGRAGEAVAQIRAGADSVLAGRFDLLGYRGLFFGDPPDWHLDPVSDRRAPLVHWSELDVLDTRQVGDSKVTWELNRHQWLVGLGQAYRLSGDERYAERFAATITDWTRQNPAGLGINWASSLELALRLIAWCWALFLFRGSRALGPEIFVEMLGSVADHAGHIASYLSQYSSPNTHLTGEALGLVYAGIVFPELRGARRWRRLGERILVQELRRQVLADGVHFERSTCYHRYTLEIYLHFLLLAARSGAALPPDVRGRIEGMVDVLLALRHPDGSMPQIGDADGGEILPLAPRAPDDFRGVFAIAASVFRRADCAWAAGGPAAEALWLCGPASTAGVDERAARPPEPPGSALFPEGGYAVMRSGWDRRAHQLIFDVGPLGCPVTGGHGHADLLGIQCAAFGEPTVVDPGTYCYTADPAWRDFFRGTAAHSTLRIDGLDQALPRGAFAWETRPHARLTRWASSETLDVVDAEHAAYERLPDPVIHRRRILWVKPRYWVIVDDLLGRAEHAIELRFQFAPCDVDADATLWARARTAAGPGLLLRPFATAALTAEVAAGRLVPPAGWVSPAYGRRRPAPALIYRALTRLPMRIATLLLPIDSAVTAPPAVTPLLDDGGQLVGLHFVDGREVLRFDEPERLVAG